MEVAGILDNSNISQHLRAWVMQDDPEKGQRGVCGIIGPGTSRSLTSKWDAPMEQANAGNDAGFVGDTAQAATGMTAVTGFSSTQIWQGNMPIKFSLNLIFIAQNNAAEEVMKPLQWLEEFASGKINSYTAMGLGTLYAQGKALVTGSGGGDSKNLIGRIPGRVSLDIGRKSLFTECVIENINIPMDKERDSKGNLIRAEVQLDIQTLKMISQEDIAASWGGASSAKQ